jgi:DGQHR domain-containing protein
MASPRGKTNYFKVMLLQCGQLPVIVGAAPASVLCALSFADVLDERTDRGYQRPIDRKHARGFREYIGRPGATTIPLTFNLRGPEGKAWRLRTRRDGTGTLVLRAPSDDGERVLAQVDCQHRLGMMADSDITLTFQCYLGLSAHEEMAIFNVINGNAKGLSPSLLDYHTTKLVPGLGDVRPELYLAKTLNEDPDSVWYQRVKLGGKGSQGTTRRVSLRGLQTATLLFLRIGQLEAGEGQSLVDIYRALRAFWRAVARIWGSAWGSPRTHLITKGIGVQALSLLAGDITRTALADGKLLTEDLFGEALTRLGELDWSTTGPFHGYGGRHGATEVHTYLADRLGVSKTASLLRLAGKKASHAT